MLRLIFALLVLVASARAAHAACTTFSGLTYGTYGNGQSLLLDLMVPAGASAAAPVPLVLYLHGGGWSSGNRTIPVQVSDLCDRGYAVASPDYRLSNVAVWPAQIQDVKGAVRWLRANAATYGLDPDRFAAWGWSAGGHLAAMLGTTGGLATATIGKATVDLEGTTGGNAGSSSRVQAVVDWYGTHDFLQMRFYPSSANHDAATSNESHLLGGAVPGLPELSATASPISFVTADDPPFFVQHGTADTTVPYNQSELLVDALRLHGVDTTFVPLQGAGHGSGEFTTAENLQRVYDFLDRVLGPRPATVSIQATADAAEAGPAPGSFTVSRTGDASAPLTVRFVPAGTARIGADYSLSPAWSVTIPAGAGSADLAVTPVDDSRIEGPESVVLSLATDPAYAVDVTRASATLTLADDESAAGLPVLTIAAADAAGSEIGPDPAAFTISADVPPAQDLTVLYSVSGTATNGADYAALSGSVVLPAGTTSVPLDIAVLQDSLLETTETVIVTLEPAQGYAVGSAAVTSVRIAEADALSTKPIISVAASDPYGSEPGTDDGQYVLSRTGSTSSPLTVDLTVRGDGQPGQDFCCVPGSVTFGTGASKVFVTLNVLDDSQTEDPESEILSVLPDTSQFLTGPYAAAVTIADNDPSPGPGSFHTLPPCRLVDTRGLPGPVGAGGAPRLESGEVRVFDAAGHCGVPPDAFALAVNVTAIAPDSQGFLTLYATGPPHPLASTLSFQAGQTRANGAILSLAGSPPGFAVFGGTASGGVDLVVDVTGYFR